MNSKINTITIYKDTNLIELNTTCPHCKNNNIHTIEHASTIKKTLNNSDAIVIDFNQFGTRVCDYIKCRSNYSLYKKEFFY
jgi:S-ribosylhomocysteine lyase LuxS involved in autoinducer biosynthesis